jgi:hypothetical protein
MAKKENLSKPHGEIPIKKGIRNSKSYKRVKNHGKYEGIFLYKYQLEHLISQIPSNANGLWFVIGDNVKNQDIITQSTKTVEILPATLILEQNKMSIAVNTDIRGKINSNLESLLLNDSDIFELPSGAVALPGPSIPSQRTPPPKPEE